MDSRFRGNDDLISEYQAPPQPPQNSSLKNKNPFPHHFDGVIAIAPAMRVSRGAAIAAMWDTQALAAIAPQNADGKSMLAQALTNADLALIRKGILDKRDAQNSAVQGQRIDRSGGKIHRPATVAWVRSRI